jgi:hypothetical protein
MDATFCTFSRFKASMSATVDSKVSRFKASMSAFQRMIVIAMYDDGQRPSPSLPQHVVLPAYYEWRWTPLHE